MKKNQDGSIIFIIIFIINITIYNNQVIPINTSVAIMIVSALSGVLVIYLTKKNNNK